MRESCVDWSNPITWLHDDVIKWNHFPRYWSPVNSPHKGQWRGALTFSLICYWTNGWVNSWDAGDLIRHRAHYDVTVMCSFLLLWILSFGITNVTWSLSYSSSCTSVALDKVVNTIPQKGCSFMCKKNTALHILLSHCAMVHHHIPW